ncbi:phosphodiesterase [Microbacterium betulae]|uniref:Phosphodiesterase n=1 Tax=Microbacterium betulae TaxID=2981139 RepID=A0AA97I5X1_9MICO|nr:phosphodiesterase [Microbacterium sp. AB]WOF24211.1 phosphodiesterase [Microbacterium sp. AB]
MAGSSPTPRAAEYARPSHLLVHLSDTHLRAEGGVFGIDAARHLRRVLAELESSGARPDALVFTGDLADLGEADAYAHLREVVAPAAERLGSRVIWVMGNHDDRDRFRRGLLGEAGDAPVDAVHEIDGLRVIVLDTSVPGAHHGEVSPEQLEWLALELAIPAPHGTVLAMHHPPMPCVLDLATLVELRDQKALADVLRGSDVRTILAGHVHFSSTATFAGIPVSVASSSCYTQDLTLTDGSMRPRDGAQSYNLVHVYEETVVHSVVPFSDAPALETTTADETARRLQEAGVVIPPSMGRSDALPPPTAPLAIVG